MTPLKIIISTFFLAIVYGILHDMVTAHLSVEYFTIGHPKIIESESPVILALTWGVVATWWLALPMGALIALVNHIGKKPSLTFSEVFSLIIRLVFIMFSMALLGGLIGYFLTESGVIYLASHLSEKIEISKHSKFLAAGWAHVFSYISSIIGTVVLCIIIIKRRKKLDASKH